MLPKEGFSRFLSLLLLFSFVRTWHVCFQPDKLQLDVDAGETATINLETHSSSLFLSERQNVFLLACVHIVVIDPSSGIQFPAFILSCILASFASIMGEWKKWKGGVDFECGKWKSQIKVGIFGKGSSFSQRNLKFRYEHVPVSRYCFLGLFVPNYCC